MKTKVVTSFSAKLWERYANKCIASWVEHLNLDEGSLVEIWINGAFPKGLPTKTNSGTPVTYKSLDVQSDAWKVFYDTFRKHNKPETPPGQEYKFNFVPFSCKVFTLAEAAWSLKEDKNFDTFLWLDADITLIKEVTSEFLSTTIGTNNLAWLDRGPAWNYCGETGFMLSSAKDDSLDIFLTQANIWGAGQLFFFAEWHDAFTFSSCVRYMNYLDPVKFQVRNLNEDMDASNEQGLYPFKTSVLKSYMTHAKGHLKDKTN